MIEAYLTKIRRNEPAICKGSCCAEESPLEVSGGATSIFNVFACRCIDPRSSVPKHTISGIYLELDGNVWILTPPSESLLD